MIELIIAIEQMIKFNKSSCQNSVSRCSLEWGYLWLRLETAATTDTTTEITPTTTATKTT